MRLTARAGFPLMLALSFVLHCELSLAGTTASRGGSNLAHYDLGANKGVVYNYCVANQGNCGPYGAKATIDSDLQTMRNNGQYRLRIPIFHARGNQTNYVTMSSTGGDLSTQHRSNLQQLLATIKLKGFSEVIISFHPQDHNLPAGHPPGGPFTDWSGSANDWLGQPPGSPTGTTYSNLYQENFNLILNEYHACSGE